MHYRVLGLMSGTSLDGLDLCLVEFQMDGSRPNFEIQKASTLPYSSEWLKRLKFSELTAQELAELNVELGVYFGQCAKVFLEDGKVDLIASHGHTMYHNPMKNYSVQLGHGGVLAETSGFKVVSDFRSQDIILGGQGAPLVPIGDRDLFKDYDVCVNLGGFANVSLDTPEGRLAWDICPVNFVLNYLAEKEGKPFDEGGKLAKEGRTDKGLLDQLNALPYYHKIGAKSLGAEWVWDQFMPLLKNGSLPNKDLMSTVVDHCAIQIGQVIGNNTALITGGGAKNEFLIESICNHAPGKVVVPSSQIVDFKEALIFAYLGVLRVLERTNVLASATGASRDSVSGAIYLPL